MHYRIGIRAIMKLNCCKSNTEDDVINENYIKCREAMIPILCRL